jgi:hypothetical protein
MLVDVRVMGESEVPNSRRLYKFHVGRECGRNNGLGQTYCECKSDIWDVEI